MNYTNNIDDYHSVDQKVAEYYMYVMEQFI